MSDKIPENDLYKAMVLIRNLRAQAINMKIDPRATRVALKMALLVDDYHSGQVLTPDEDQALTRMAQDLFRRAKRGFERRRP